MSTLTDSMLRACTLDELREKSCIVVRGADRPIAVFYNGGQVRAVDNRCPHMGFPLSRGSCDNGMITCPWHHARFDAASGCTFDLFADDVPAYDVEVRGADVFVAPQPRGGDVRQRAAQRLIEGLQMNVSLIAAKSILALRGAKVPDAQIVREIALYGLRNRDAWGSGMTILTAMANLLPLVGAETGYLCLYQGARRVAGETAGQPARRPRRALETDELSVERLGQWLAHWTRVRHRDAAERTLRTMLRHDAPRAVGEQLFAAVCQRLYADGGHLLDFSNKALELLEIIGWEHADDVLPALVQQLVSARGGEESDEWHHPIDLVALVRQQAPALLAAAEAGRGRTWAGEAELAEALLADDPAAVVNAVTAAAGAGATPAQLGQALAYAAALRIARFGTANEMGDWISALHSFTYCNALHQALKRCPSPALLAAVLHGAMSVYLNRFLNVPPAHLPGVPGERDALDDEPRDAAELLAAFAAALDRQQQISRAARLVARYVDLGHPLPPLLDALTSACVREDADFHTFQMVEAALRQVQQGPAGPQRRTILIAAARYLAAHSPTQRAQAQTARIALRLHRGEQIYEES